ncbi:HDOD domain-containing protein [Mariprofundus sp. EBB-1]|uniref:HDOD domain-containing protein n=1 Tax=Mariprofundus sp. EBB-1 TaxID=2650971 RepID=UPI000EF1D8B2|nr:HDOD domain-containing protein [Mariprofundus sp. EBB-1]RLL56016.1 HDOD domain-containing protein [Mariprofundus sp. EBB-1]
MPDQFETSCFKINHDDTMYEQLIPAEGSAARLTMYKKSISSLPLPSALWNAFQRACDDGSSSSKLAEIIKEDPVLSASILRSANAVGLLHAPINDIARAISRIGHSMVRSVVASHSFSSSKTSEGKIYSIPALWRHGIAVSSLAEIIADHIPGCNRSEAGTMGLFHDIGNMGFNLITEYIQPAERDLAKGHLVYECERFGCTHIDMGLLLASHWQLPEKICQGIEYHHHPAYSDATSIPSEIRAEVLAVYLADLLAIKLDCVGGNPGIILPHASFASMLPDTTLADLANDKKVRSEIALIQAIEF